MDELLRELALLKDRIYDLELRHARHKHLGDVDQTQKLSAGAAAGNDTEIQFNDNGVLAGDGNFVWDKTLHFLTIGSPAYGESTFNTSNGGLSALVGMDGDGFDGGQANIYSGNALSGNNNGGNSFWTGGNGHGSGSGASLHASAGAGGATGAGGAVSMASGAAGGGNAAGGAFSITAGNGAGSGAGGEIDITAGSGGATGSGADMNLRAGATTDNGGTHLPGNARLIGGNSNNASANNGVAGEADLQGGASTGGNAGGGRAQMSGGVATGTGIGGDIYLVPGTNSDHPFNAHEGELYLITNDQATNRNRGFVHLQCYGAGAPTGTPVSNYALYYDTTNNKLYFYNSAWKSVALT